MAPTTIPPNRNPPNNLVNTNDTGTKLAIKRLLAINPNTPLYIRINVQFLRRNQQLYYYFSWLCGLFEQLSVCPSVCYLSNWQRAGLYQPLAALK